MSGQNGWERFLLKIVSGILVVVTTAGLSGAFTVAYTLSGLSTKLDAFIDESQRLREEHNNEHGKFEAEYRDIRRRLREVERSRP